MEIESGNAATPVRDVLREVLLLQRKHASTDSDDMIRRGHLLKVDLADRLTAHLAALSADPEVAIDDLRVEARDATGRYSEIPWARVHSASRSSSAMTGWYVVYLFDSPGEHVFLCLMQGTNQWVNNAYKRRPTPELLQRVAWAREVLADRLEVRPDLVRDISLRARGKKLAPGYEVGTVVAFDYHVDDIPADAELEDDLRFLVTLLSTLHVAAEQALDLPGEPAPEIAEVVDASDRAAGRRGGRGQGRRLSAEERRAIERRAVDMAIEDLVAQGYTVRDVGATQPYDLDARRGSDEHLFVEVKGTTSLGEEVVLTHGEVRFMTAHHPDTVLVVVRSIRLDRSGGTLTASGGDLTTTRRWKINQADLTPVSYRYRMPTPDA